MAKLLVLLALVLAVCLVEARHVHPRSIVRLEEEGEKSGVIMEIDGTPIDVIRNLKPSRIVPFNTYFFPRYTPCLEGFERDLSGICREVWD